MKYKSGNPIKTVDTNTIADVAEPDLHEVYEAYRYYYIMVGYPSSKIKSFSEFANSYPNIRINAVNMYYIAASLLPNNKFRKNLLGKNKGYLPEFALTKANAFEYVCMVVKELGNMQPDNKITLEEIKNNCLIDYSTFTKTAKESAKKRVEVASSEYDKYLDGMDLCSKDEYVRGSTDYAKKMKSILMISKDAYRKIKDSDPKPINISSLGNIDDENSTIKNIFQCLLVIDKLNRMGYKKLSVEKFDDLLSYISSFAVFAELASIEDESVVEQISETNENIRRKPDFNEKFGSMANNEIELLRFIYHSILAVNDINKYSTYKIIPENYITLPDDTKKQIEISMLGKMKTLFAKTPDSDLKSFFSNSVALLSLSEEDRKKFLSEARSILERSLEITQSIIENDSVMKKLESVLGIRTFKDVFEYVNSIQPYLFMYKMMYHEDYSISSADDLIDASLISARYMCIVNNIPVDFGTNSVPSSLSEEFEKLCHALVNDFIDKVTFHLFEKKGTKEDRDKLFNKAKNYVEGVIAKEGLDYIITLYKTDPGEVADAIIRKMDLEPMFSGGAESIDDVVKKI